MIDLLSIFIGGDSRIVLPFFAYPSLLAIPSLMLTCLIMMPHLSSVVKQALSVPLLLAVFFMPFGFTNGNKVMDLMAGVTNYNIFLRYLELYWVGPFVQDRPVYATFDSLWIDFWGCLRVFPKAAKEDTPELKKGQVKQYPKDKKFYHIIFSLVGHLIVTDLVASWMTSFTGHDIGAISVERPVIYFWFYFAANIILNSAFNAVGSGLQLFYVIFFEQGSYSSEQWRSLMINPVLSTSLDELWSHRWHQLFKSTWLAFPFRPVRILTTRLLTKRVKNAKSIAFLVATISVFVASALMHEYVIAANMGWSIYRRFFQGEQCVFFVGHGLGVFFEHLVQLLITPKLSPQFKGSFVCQLIQRAWTVMFGYFTFYYIMNGFMTWGFHFDNPIAFTKPFVMAYVRQHPILLDYFGSHL